MTKPIAVVTGGAGFIGSHMVDLLLEKGYQVRVIDNLVGGHAKNLAAHTLNPDFFFEKMDILDIKPDSPLFKDAQFVFHFAGIGDIVPSIEQPIQYMETNVLGTAHVLQAARTANVKKFVYAASSSCYGLATTPTQESHPIQPQYPYALSKYQGESAAFHWHQVYKLPVNSVRIFNAYGTRVRTTGAYGAVFGVFFKQKLLGKPYTVVGDGKQTRDFLYVTDVARAFLAAAETPMVGEIWNIGAGQPQSVNHLVDLLDGKNSNIEYVPKRPGEPDCTWADISKITKELGWEPKVAFKEGVQMMLDDIDHWQDAPLWDKSSIETATRSWFEYLS
ncbi:MAG: NAD-dependent epimerase/dehydratase family protein [Gammaproteobacteria bacterium]|jgi:UDP-glucose 4-epimerase|nr:NAD-dependent epimerase/dehydratase family protein [Gammaproteobacteria bacterium]